MNAVIVIPVYRESINEFEFISINQTLSILGSHPVVIVAPDSLDISIYSDLINKYKVRSRFERFKDSYFTGIEGYNRLLLSPEFYLRFSKYKYMLICQPDVYVFRDELAFWCEKEYDFIGAPLIGNHEDKEFSIKMRVGNGGFSLRKVETYIHFFESNKNVFTPKQVFSLINILKKPYTRIFVWFLMIFGWRNKPLSCAQYWKYNEDDFWSGYLDKSNYKLRKPTPSEALKFAFERFPKECYKITEKLPFGCHAWGKYEYEDFWEKHIK